MYRKRLEGISHIIERKHKMETKIREVDSSIGHRSSGRDRKRRLSGELVDQLESVDSIRQLMAALA